MSTAARRRWFGATSSSSRTSRPGSSTGSRPTARASRSRPEGPFRYADLGLDASRNRAPRGSRGPHARTRRRRGVDRRDPPRRVRPGRRPRIGPRLLFLAALVARRVATRIPGLGSPEHALGRHRAARRRRWPGREPRRPRACRGVGFGLDHPAALVARRRPVLRRRADRLAEPPSIPRRARRAGHRPRGGVRLSRLGLRPPELRVRAGRHDRGDRAERGSRSPVPGRPGGEHGHAVRPAVHGARRDRRPRRPGGVHSGRPGTVQRDRHARPPIRLVGDHPALGARRHGPRVDLPARVDRVPDDGRADRLRHLLPARAMPASRLRRGSARR